MAVVAVFSAPFCEGEQVAQTVAKKLGYSWIDDTFLDDVGRQTGTAPDKLRRALTHKPGLLESLRLGWETHLARVKEALGARILSDNVVYHGRAGLLLPADATHVLRVCIVANQDHRIAVAHRERSLSEQEAKRIIADTDKETLQWSDRLFGKAPWSEHLNDLVLPMHDRSVEDAAALICENVGREALATTPPSLKAVEELIVSAGVAGALLSRGYDVEVANDDGHISVVIRKFVFWLSHVAKKIENIAGALPGVKDVEVGVGPEFHGADRYMDYFEQPPKVLLVDDERDFVETLSERLEARKLTPTLAFDGQHALDLIEQDVPEVMVLDLRMPNIGGMEVLRRTKKNHPQTEIIILTGHGSDREEMVARELGAFAYLRKPVDFEVLTRTLKEAHRRVQRSKEETGST